MIKKSRLEELIKQDKKIYFIDWTYKEIKSVNKIVVSDYIITLEIVNDLLYVIRKEDAYKPEIIWTLKLSDIFETKEEAEWYKEFGSIERTETLKLPTWEEFNKDNFGIKFYNKDREFRLHRVRYSSSDKNPLWRIDLYASYGDDEDTIAWKKSWDLTKENYIESCKLCVKLFKGEE